MSKSDKKPKDKKDQPTVTTDGKTVTVHDREGGSKVIFHGGVGELHVGGEFHEDFHF